MARNKELGVLGASKIAINSVLIATAGAAVAVKSASEAVVFASEGMARSGAKALLEDDNSWSEAQLQQVDSGELKTALMADLLSEAMQRPSSGNVASIKASVINNK